MINIGETFIIAYLSSNKDDDNQNNALNKIKLKIFPPNSLDKPDTFIGQND